MGIIKYKVYGLAKLVRTFGMTREKIMHTACIDLSLQGVLVSY